MNENSKETINLEPIALEKEDLDFLRDLAHEKDIQFFNARFAKGRATSFSILHKISKSSNLGIGKGYSITAFTKGGYGFAVGYDFSKDAISETFERASKLAHWSSQFVKTPFKIAETPSITDKFEIKQKTALHSVDPTIKIKNLLEIEEKAYFDPRIVSTSVSYSDSEIEKLIYNGNGNFIRVKESGIFFIIQAIAKEGHRQEGFYVSHGEMGGYEIMENSSHLGKEAADNALELLNSKPAPKGVHHLIMDPLLTGTFVHEAFGHAAEADGILSDQSILAGKIGQRVGGEQISIIDDPTIAEGFGFCPYDDEGTKGHKTSIVEKGILTGFLHNLESSSKLDVKPTGNGRAGSFSSIPQVRMTNTYVGPGDSNLDEMLSEMKNGLCGSGWKYGYTDPIDGTFQFKLAKAYLVENGEKTQVLRDCAISGMTLDVLKRVDLISKELKFDAGHCGKGGQTLSVGSGGPHVLIKDMVIGGQ